MTERLYEASPLLETHSSSYVRQEMQQIKILDTTTQKFIHLDDKACGLDNIRLLKGEVMNMWVTEI